MCLTCDRKTAAIGLLSKCCENRLKTGEGNRQPGPLAGRHCVDPVRAMRLRELLERTVMTGLGPRLFPHRMPNRCVLPPPNQGRGGAEQTFVRQVAIYLSHVGCGLSYSQAGSLYERDRTTAAHACTIVEERRDDPYLDHILALLEVCIRAEFRRIDPRLAQTVIHRGRAS
jgi:hypothetical protein